MSESGHPHELNQLEMRLLELPAEGLSDDQIAVDLNVPQQSLEEHMAGVLRKMESRSRTEAAIKAIKRGLLGVGIAAALIAAMIVNQSNRHASSDESFAAISDQVADDECSEFTWMGMVLSSR